MAKDDLTNSGVPQSEADVLAGYYRRAGERLREMVLNPMGKTDSSRAFNQARAAILFRQVDELLRSVNGSAAGWVGEHFPQAYMDGINLAEQQARDAGVDVAGSGIAGSFNAVDRRAVQVFAQDTMAYLAKATASMGENSKRILRSIAAEKLSNQDLNRILAGGVIEGRPRDTIRELKKELDRVYDGGMVTITTASGGMMTFEPGYYAEMVARTRTREAVVTAKHNRFRDLGEDLVSIIGRVSDNFCTAFLGEVFSLSGTHPKYPAYSSLPGGGPPFHPNCSKSTRLYIEALASDAQKEVAEGVEGAKKLRGMSPTQAQRAYKDLQLRKEVEQSYKRVTPIKGPKRMTVDGQMAHAKLPPEIRITSATRTDASEVSEMIKDILTRHADVIPEGVQIQVATGSAKQIEIQRRRRAAFSYDAVSKTILVNPDIPNTDELEQIAALAAKRKYTSSGGADHFFLNDLGHRLHHEKVKDAKFFAMMNSRFTHSRQREMIRREVSSYATESQAEFVAEVFAARCNGRSFPKSIDDLYTRLDGP